MEILILIVLILWLFVSTGGQKINRNPLPSVHTKRPSPPPSPPSIK